MNPDLHAAIKSIESLISAPAESIKDPAVRLAEFQARLPRVRAFLDILGNPHQQQAMIHIGGTSGKGSIAIIVESLLDSLGLRVGTHTSPYLQSPTEKIRVNRPLITPATLIGLAEQTMQAAHQLDDTTNHGLPQYTEAWFALACQHIAAQGCDVGVIEVSMGGRYDTTNVIDPAVTVISTVHYDHTRALGSEIEQIADHKAGIIKQSVPVFIGPMADAAVDVIIGEAQAQDAPLYQLGKDIHITPRQMDESGGQFDYRGLHLSLSDAHLGLIGWHQFDNAALALAAVESYAAQQQIELDEAAIRDGLARVRFAGRMEIMQHQPMVILDGAHNEQKLHALTDSIRRIANRRRLTVVLGMLGTKNATESLPELVVVADRVITTTPQVIGKPGTPADALADTIRSMTDQRVEAISAPHDALAAALDSAMDDDLILITGSLYLVGAMRDHWYHADDILRQGTMFPRRTNHD